jgi:hypothetical protein
MSFPLLSCSQFASGHLQEVPVWLMVCSALDCCVVCWSGEGTWLNPVQPVLPEGYAHGELHLSSQKAVAAVQAAAAAAGLPDAVVRGVKLMAV